MIDLRDIVPGFKLIRLRSLPTEVGPSLQL